MATNDGGPDHPSGEIKETLTQYPTDLYVVFPEPEGEPGDPAYQAILEKRASLRVFLEYMGLSSNLSTQTEVPVADSDYTDAAVRLSRSAAMLSVAEVFPIDVGIVLEMIHQVRPDMPIVILHPVGMEIPLDLRAFPLPITYVPYENVYNLSTTSSLTEVLFQIFTERHVLQVALEDHWSNDRYQAMLAFVRSMPANAKKQRPRSLDHIRAIVANGS